jgi:heme/copper-type cytochrome/quinol oxidase subunit 2
MGIMNVTRRTVGLLLIGAGTLLVAGPAVARLFAQPSEVGAGQEQAPNRREFTVTARDYHFSPERLEVTQDDLVKLTVRSEDVAYSLTIDEYRVSKRVPAGGSTTFEFRADRPGTFPFYSNLTSDARHGQTKGQLVVRGR